MTGFYMECNIQLKRVKSCSNNDEGMSKGLFKTCQKSLSYMLGRLQGTSINRKL